MRLRAAACGAAVAAALALAATALEATETGAEAFARGDFIAAEALWRREAAAGAAEAKFGLGLINDLGLGGTRDAAKALRWYLEAAVDGFAAAQFNVGVMLDAGTGVPRDVVAAAVWYGRAAANEHARAQYNLGLLYAAGEGVPANADLARVWLARAAETLPAAEERLASLGRPQGYQRVLAVPNVLAGAVVPDGEGGRAELVWSAPPGPIGARYLLEVARLPAGDARSGTIVAASLTDASARSVRLPAPSAAYAWRVSLVDADASRYAACPWQRLDSRPDAGPLPEGRVTLRVAPGDAEAAVLASQLAEDFRGANLWASVAPAGDAATESSVRYSWGPDAELAEVIAEFLPVLGAADAVLSPELGAAPGEIVVRLVGGPAEPSR